VVALAGLIYGSWVDGASIGLMALYLAAFVAILTGGLWWVSRRNQAHMNAAQEVSK